MDDEDWMRGMRDWAGGIRPVGDVVGTVGDGVRRRRRQRAGVVAGTCAAVLVAATAVGVAALPGPAGDRRTPPAPAAAEFSCPTESRIFTERPPIADLDEQERVVERIGRLSSVWVRHAEPTALGVVALVGDASGDEGLRADPQVADRLRRLGVAHVYEWDPTISSAGVDAAGQVERVVGWSLDPAYRDVRRATRGIPGSGGIAYWNEAGAILVSWKAPVPAQVAALVGTRPDGVRVVVDAVRYSERDVRRAQDRLQDWLVESGLRDDWTSSFACGDRSGLIVGMNPRVARRTALAERISEAVGMPTMVVSEEPWEEGPGPLVESFQEPGARPVG